MQSISYSARLLLTFAGFCQEAKEIDILNFIKFQKMHFSSIMEGYMFTLDMILLFKQCCTIPLGIPLASQQLIENIPENNSLLCHIYHAENVTFYEYNLLSKSICERGQ